VPNAAYWESRLEGKTRYFFGIENGGWTAALLTSFITSCTRLNIDPLAYFRDRLGVCNT